MNVLIIGGGGFLGTKLAHALTARAELRGRPITGLTLADLSVPDTPDAPFDVASKAVDITDPDSVASLIDGSNDVIYLLAAVVSAHAEADFETGMNVNLHGVLNVLERCRALESAPVLVFTSSLAVFGGDVPDPIEDWTIPNPQTSYGVQKAIGEQLVNDYSRRGFIDGRTLRLPTISVRPGKPNRAASSFMSSIIREPLNGQEAVCPVDPDFEHYYLSPRRCVENLVRTAELDAGDLGQSRTITLPGQTLTVQQMIDAMTRVAGPEPAKLIRWEKQPEVEKIVRGWRSKYNARKAQALGLVNDDGFEDNVRAYLEDDLPSA